jgi:NAD(P)-dependent dehydrogenase (short-subunit alcohol dehydrogenase family)
MTLGIVVGATGGIGGACAKALAGSVKRMVVTGRDSGKLTAIAREVGAGVTEVIADIATDAGRGAILQQVAGEEIRWLVIASGAPLRGALDELDPAAIADIFQSNLIGPALLLRALADARWSNPASVAIIGSISATRAIARRSVYAASKAGLERLAMSLGAEWAPRGIRVTVVAPGIIATPFLGTDQSRLDAWVKERVPSRRSGTPAEVADVVRYVVLDAPDYLIGARIAVDGGMEATA